MLDLHFSIIYLTKDGAKLCKACNGYVGVVKFSLKWHDGAKT